MSIESPAPKKDLTHAITAQGVYKKFKIFYDKGSTLKERLILRGRNRYAERWVLRGVNLDIRQGESVGLIGENGSGKSTLLKILSKILYPNKGTVTVNGRISSLLELGAGFHPDLSGRENIYNNASIFGLTEKEIDKRLPLIIEFSELNDYIDNPVRTYSSGMYMRLAFSVAINVDADVLLIDEILAVGDSNFQRKCFNMLRTIKHRGTTILIVSHSLNQIEQFCDRTLWLENGVIRMDGSPRLVHMDYLAYMDEKARKQAQQRAKATEGKPEQTVSAEISNQGEYDPTGKRFGTRALEVVRIRTIDGDGRSSTVFSTGESLVISIEYKRNQRFNEKNIIVGVNIARNDGAQIYGTNTLIDHGSPLALKDAGTIEFRIEQNYLMVGQYEIDVALHSTENVYYDYVRGAATIQMISSLSDIGMIRLQHEWCVDGAIISR